MTGSNIRLVVRAKGVFLQHYVSAYNVTRAAYAGRNWVCMGM